MPPVQPGRYWYSPHKGGASRLVEVELVGGELIFRPIEDGHPIPVGRSSGWWREDELPPV